MPSRAVAVDAHRAALMQCASRGRTCNRLKDAAGAVCVKRTQDARVRYTVEACVASAICYSDAAGETHAVAWALNSRDIVGASWTVKISRALGTLGVESVVCIAIATSVVCVQAGAAYFALLANHVA